MCCAVFFSHVLCSCGFVCVRVCLLMFLLVHFTVVHVAFFSVWRFRVFLSGSCAYSLVVYSPVTLCLCLRVVVLGFSRISCHVLKFAIYMISFIFVVVVVD